jgi:Fe-S-cluster-containing dehydrogenase component/anaerobic selenocysteine-containing dehydrogenase
MLDVPPLIDRRAFVKLMGAALAMSGSACTRKPLEPIVPYARAPEMKDGAEPLFFATALVRGGYAHGVLVETHEGRPTKIEGNVLHPASLGATGPIEQGRILELWDPDRSRAVLKDTTAASFEMLRSELISRLRQLKQRGGAGLHVLTGAISSPGFQRQWQGVRAAFPEAQHHHYEPVSRDAVYAGGREAFGRALEPIFHFDRARIVLALDADFLGTLPGHVRYARDFTSRRQPAQMSRLYAAECMPTLTGAAADERRPTRACDVQALAGQIERALSDRSRPADRWLSGLIADLSAHPGESLVVVGEGQPSAVHAMAYRINQRLGNIGRTLDFIVPPIDVEESDHDSLVSLLKAMQGGQVDTLLVLDSNPVYDAPADLGFAAALARVNLSIHAGLYVDETARAARWHVPLAHELEHWSDARAFDGTVTIQQPLIAPLYGGHSRHQVMALLTPEASDDGYALVRDTWTTKFGADAFEERWQDGLRNGVVSGTAAQLEAPSLVESRAAAIETRPAGEGIELHFAPDPNVWDGRYANIAWLQELPKPLSQLTWDNAAFMSAQLAARLKVKNEDVVELSANGRKIEAPVWIVPGHADSAITLHLGGGRRSCGEVGEHRGVDAFGLRTLATQGFVRAVQARSTGKHFPLATVQLHHRMEGREPVRSASLGEFTRDPNVTRREADARHPSLYRDHPYEGHAWGMSIDLNACIGCNACTIACQAENNIPTVGKEEVRRGREMHWIRVDRYEEGSPEVPKTHFQPVPCMQCERAPCEVVCPVEASVHDEEGINVQVYNRCVGTRFCSNNCPYKVRRFNFLSYARDEPSLNAQRNPEVTVRMRGVMEKCNYCLQRIVRGRITAERENRPLRDGEVLTACQAVCPTQAIVFGDLNDPKSAVRGAKSSPRDYVLLGELNTRPRTSYLAKITNAHDEESES